MASQTQALSESSAPPASDVVQKNAKKLKFIPPPTFTDKEEERKYKLGKLAAAFRIFAEYGFDEGVAGHLTLRDPILTDHFWVNPFGRAFSQMTVSDLLLINPEGEIVMGGKPDRQVYNELLISLDITTQDACAFYNDLAVYRGFGGVVLAAEEGNNIAKALGQNKAVILQNHGLLTTGTSIEAAVWWFISLESLCRIQLLADAAAGGRGIQTIKAGEKEAEFTYRAVGSHMAGWAQAQPYFDRIHEKTGGAHLL
ncbi:uncharacterized protein VP01_2427g2 [Puccinia sorghi]|uniref:Class II aldolase/adducin N-terminal domain-containing protein n=1 Tax=Puccinia sorghi TaxID=27349 RepID=A0A0L6V6M6_9BASI|nr:uncharacterized protein VP01_2427g2 [Puccinia sorghi]